MKNFHRHLCCVWLAMSASASFASTSEPTQTPAQEAASPSAAIAAARAVLEQRDFETTYTLANGKPLVVTSFGEVLRARYARRAPITLRHDGQGHFASSDGSVVMQFVAGALGDTEKLQISVPGNWL
jgi:hypothetical protein